MSSSAISTSTATPTDPLGRFTTRSTAYEAGRPSYPPEAIAALLADLAPAAQLTVADVGAGTGISTRVLAATGARVLAVEPNAAMRAKGEARQAEAAAAGSTERIEWIDATGEDCAALADASVDLSVAFQAWHWVNHDTALREQQRIVRRGGRIAVVYNERDENDATGDAFTRAVGDIFRKFALDGTEALRETTRLRFAAIPGAVSLQFGNRQRLDAAGLRARFDSSSFLPRADTEAGARMHAEVAALFERFARTGGSEEDGSGSGGDEADATPRVCLRYATHVVYVARE
jgi:SAM-dependent methyltransferase